MHLDDIDLPQIIVSSKYDLSSRKIFSRWSVQLLDELPLLALTMFFIGSHISYTIINWLMHNNACDEIRLRFISFFSHRSFLSFMSFVMLFFEVRCCSYCRFLSFAYHSFLSSFNSRFCPPVPIDWIVVNYY